MQIKIFTIPILSDDRDTEELNHFLRANKVIDIKKDVVLLDGNSCWSFCVTYIPSIFSVDNHQTSSNRQMKVDYKEILDAKTFDRFAKMRKLRKQIADNEAIPAYAVFTDAELAEIAKLAVLDTANIMKIRGIGKKKVEKYGSVFCMTDYSMIDNEESGMSDREDSGS